MKGKKRKKKKLKTKIRKQKQLVTMIYNYLPCNICLVLPVCKARFSNKKGKIKPSCIALEEFLDNFRCMEKITNSEANAIATCFLSNQKNKLDQIVESSVRYEWEKHLYLSTMIKRR